MKVETTRSISTVRSHAEAWERCTKRAIDAKWQRRHITALQRKRAALSGGGEIRRPIQACSFLTHSRM